jgi:hypothetical protein
VFNRVTVLDHCQGASVEPEKKVEAAGDTERITLDTKFGTGAEN